MHETEPATAIAIPPSGSSIGRVSVHAIASALIQRPAVVLHGELGTDQPEDCSAVLGDADEAGAAANLLVELTGWQ